MRCRNDDEDDGVDVIEVEYRADAGEVSLVLRTLRLTSAVNRCDDDRAGGVGDLPKKKKKFCSEFAQKVSRNLRPIATCIVLVKLSSCVTANLTLILSEFYLVSMSGHFSTAKPTSCARCVDTTATAIVLTFSLASLRPSD